MYRLVYIIFLGGGILNYSDSRAQLVVDNTLTPSQLVQNVLLGNGVTAFNITFTGDPQAIGTFKGNTNIGLPSGIIITTGTILGPAGPAGPNNNGSAGVDNFTFGNADLDSISGGFPTFNASILEFDFITTSDSLEFRYVFGSEEYDEFVCSDYTDVFAFFLSGVTVSYPETNIALIPGTTSTVSINSVNNGTVGSFGTTGPHCNLSNSQYYTTNNGNTIQYDGFTKVLTAKATVVCGETYHIKLAIADVGDGIYDSGVFLEAGSFSSSVIEISSEINYGGTDTILYEGCSSATLFFKRFGNLSNADTLYLSYSGTATNGLDYNLLPDTLFIGPGQSQVPLTLKALLDMLAEGVETLIITAKTNKCGISTSALFKINIGDPPPVNVSLPDDIIICEGKTATFTATGTGGINNGVLQYLWNTGEVIKTLSVSPDSFAVYYVTVTDSCGINFATDSIRVTINQINASAGNDIIICLDSSAQLSATGGLNYAWSPSTGLDNPAIANPVATPGSTQIYTVTVSDGICEGEDDVTVTVLLPPVINITPSDTIICMGTAVQLNASGAETFSWNAHPSLSATTGASVTASPDTLTTYFITGTNATGCIGDTMVTLNVFPPLSLTALSNAVLCKGQTATLNSIAAGGNGGPYYYKWSPAAGLDKTDSSMILASAAITTTYFITASDSCTLNPVTDSVLVTVMELPITRIISDSIEGCPPLTINFNSSSPDNFTFNWTFGNGISSGEKNPSAMYTSEGTYEVSLIVTDTNNCESRQEKLIIEAFPIPLADFTSAPQQVTLEDPTIFFTDRSIGNIKSWNWIFPGLNNSILPSPNYTFPDTGNFPVTLVVFNEFGCPDSVTHTVYIYPDFNLYIPNAFTPDNNEHNQVFMPKGFGVTSYNLKIFNRWGELIFESEELGKGWDGTYKGQPCQIDFYVYRVEAAGNFNKTFSSVGTVSLIR